MKKCTQCGQILPFVDFPRDPRARNGLKAACKACGRARFRAYKAAMVAEGRRWDIGPVSVTCQFCGLTFAYVKTTGRRRIYSGRQCQQNASDQIRLARAAAPSQRLCSKCKAVEMSGRRTVCDTCHADPRKGATQRSRREFLRRLQSYNLSEERWLSLLASAEQAGCPICGILDPGVRGWQIDHDRSCCPGKGSCGRCVRDLLCTNCNLMLGHSRDRVENLQRAVSYLVAHEALAASERRIA